jgi:hypothetical protein
MRVQQVKRKIALVLFGQPRFVGNGFAFQSHKWHLRKHKFDVYGHYWFSTGAKYEVSSWTGLKDKDSFVPDTAPQVIRRAFPEGTFIESPPRIFSPTESVAHLSSTYLSDYGLRTEFERLRSNPESMHSNTTSQLFSINQALGLLRASMKHYDLVVLSRWDNMVLRLPDLESVSANKLTISDGHSFGFPDLIFIGSPKLIDATDAYLAIPKIFETVPTMSAENVKQAYFFQTYSLADVERRRITVSVVRGLGLKWFAGAIIYRLGIEPTLYKLIPPFVRRHISKLLARIRKQKPK